jgi:L-threonylcarbamoyladenylate synthase
MTAARDAVTYGHDLYARLRELDAQGARRILVESPPGDVEWEAVNDRLLRAAAGAVQAEDDP